MLSGSPPDGDGTGRLDRAEMRFQRDGDERRLGWRRVSCSSTTSSGGPRRREGDVKRGFTYRDASLGGGLQTLNDRAFTKRGGHARCWSVPGLSCSRALRRKQHPPPLQPSLRVRSVSGNDDFFSLSLSLALRAWREGAGVVGGTHTHTHARTHTRALYSWPCSHR